MANSPTPNPNRRRRLTADELIAIVVALAGIGTVFFWGLGQKNTAWNLLKSGTTSLTSNTNTKNQDRLLDNNEATIDRERRTISSYSQRERDNSTTTTQSTTTEVTPTAKPAETTVETTTPAPVAPVPVAPVPVAPVVPAPAAIAPKPLPIVAAPVFTDVSKKFWGANYITELGKRGILDDFGDGKFDPTKPITRGEYAKMLDRAFADKPATSPVASFQDIPADYPRKEAVDGSVKRGFMSGYSATKFSPNEVIPRYQLQISLAKGLKLPVSANQETLLGKFTDSSKMPKYAREKMASAVDAGLVIKDLTKNQLKPTANATRADAAALIYEALIKEGKIVKP